MAVKINAYLRGNRLRVEMNFATDADLDGTFDTPTDPTLVTFLVKNLDADTTLTWTSPPDVLPTGVNATIENPEVGKWVIMFDVDVPGELVVRASGTGACKAAAERRIKITESGVLD